MNLLILGVLALHHLPPAEAAEGEAMRLRAVVDDGWQENLVVRYRAAAAPAGSAPAEAPFELSTTGEYVAVIPAAAVRRPGFDYWIVAVGGAGGEQARFASAASPHRVRVEPPAAHRWIDAERRRLTGLDSQVALRMGGQSFGKVGGVQDYYLRGEVDLTHRLVTLLYSVTVGFGFLEGSTPSDQAMDAVAERRMVRYGHGGARARVTSRVWLDGRMVMGFDRDGFVVGGGGRLTLGRPWRSCVELGLETIQGLGPALWVRLQWDTVAPLLMGVTATKTDLPDANRSDGSAIAYDVSYGLTGQLRLTGAVSFGSRGRRPGGIGGSLSASLDF
jgi:hypothetical protein